MRVDVAAHLAEHGGAHGGAGVAGQAGLLAEGGDNNSPATRKAPSSSPTPIAPTSALSPTMCARNKPASDVEVSIRRPCIDAASGKVASTTVRGTNSVNTRQASTSMRTA